MHIKTTLIMSAPEGEFVWQVIWHHRMGLGTGKFEGCDCSVAFINHLYTMLILKSEGKSNIRQCSVTFAEC